VGWLFFVTFEVTMKNGFRTLVRVAVCWMVVSFLACGEGGLADAFRLADSLNRQAYEVRYKDWHRSEELALEALKVGKGYSAIKAEALNNLAFCAFIQMDFERADSLLNEVYNETTNELECLVADVGMMKICQRTAMNKEFYDYRNSALRRMKRIGEDEEAMKDVGILKRFNYACSEFSITSSVYYYYLQQETQSLEAIDEIDINQELDGDTAQLLYYYYMKGSGGMYEAPTPEEVLVGEFDFLMDCLMLSHEQGYVYFEANASQAMAELLKDRTNYDLLLEKRPGMMRIVNRSDLPWEELVIAFAESALKLFKQYDDWYQISGTYRTLASCYNELGQHEEALEHLTEALSYVNLHHEKFYHCHDTLDRLKPYIPEADQSIELKWINAEGIMTVPEWIARFREQLSVTYSALGMKPQSDYNRNIYLDILDYTRQDKELESRYLALEEESNLLNMLLVLVMAGLVLVIFLMIYLNRRWRIRNVHYVERLKDTLEISRMITASVPSDAEEVDDVVEAVMTSVKDKLMTLVGASDMWIHPMEEENEEICPKENEFLLKNSEGKVIGIWKIEMPSGMKKEDRALLEVVAPYFSWTMENGLAMILLGDERRRLEKEQYVHELHLVENKRQNLIKKACLFLVTGITPYIDRVVNEIHKLTSFNYLLRKDIKEEKYQYIGELIERINEYNDILALWIKMRQGSLSLNIENFALNPLFEVLQKGRRNFDWKKQTFLVEPTEVWVKADKALTLFMMNTLMENARKYTQQGGKIQVYAREEADYVEISVQDNGPGLTEEDVACILNEKVYDSGKIGMQTTSDTEALQKSKGSGFGLMNCKGIIEKYRKTNELFRVCSFRIDSRIGEGSRFYFRLPKGIRKMMGVCLLIFFALLTSCGHGEMVPETVFADSVRMDSVMNDSLLTKANRLAYQVYESNLEGKYDKALVYADSTLACLNAHFLKHAGFVAPLLQLVGEGASAELEWFASRFDTDYYTLLDVRNEAAVAYLALGELDAYRYNNQAYTSLYKQISVDDSLEEYCERMKLSAINKTIAIIICVALFLVLLVGYYLLYLRHWLNYRFGLEQVLEINRRLLIVPAIQYEDRERFLSALVKSLAKEMNELVSLDVLGMAVVAEDTRHLHFDFSAMDREEKDMKSEMQRVFESKTTVWDAEKRLWCLPLLVEVADEKRCLGVMALRCASHMGKEDDRLMLELVAGYVAILVYNAVELVAQKYRDIEVAQDEARRVLREENQLHVQNMVLDNCLSTIKHETSYYPNRIRQIIDRLSQDVGTKEEFQQVETMEELVAYYKDVFTILSSCAARQLEEVTFRRGVVKVQDLLETTRRYFKRATRKVPFSLELDMQADSLNVIGDEIQLKFMLENLVNEALTCPDDGRLELRAYQDGNFVRFDFIDRRREFSQEELNQVFYPHLSRMKHQGEGLLTGTEYLVCKQIIRDHDEFAGHRGCRMNACQAPEGGFMVWFTIPKR